MYVHTPLVAGHLELLQKLSGNGEHALAANYNRKMLDPVHSIDKLLPVVSKIFHCCHYSL